MLTLSSGSSCDVCAEEYGPRLQPHSIPCGHILCAPCSNTIIEKTPSRLTPVCPFCREQFTRDAIRLIRIDFTSIAYSTSRRRGPLVEDDHDQPLATNNLASKNDVRVFLMDNGCSRSRADARRLEDKVAKVAAKKCSVEEVSTLHRELQEWLTGEVNDQTSSLFLSAALLRAILMNHVAHSEASKAAKLMEANLKGKIDDLEITTAKLEAELRRQRVSYAQKAQECQNLGVELNRLKIKTGNVTAVDSKPLLTPPTSPPPPTLHAPSARSPLSRLSSSATHGAHARSASVQPQSPSSIRSGLSSAMRSATPGVHPLSRSETLTPRPPPMPTTFKQQRRLSNPSPPPITRSSSNSSEDDYIHERWIPQRAPSKSSRSSYQQPYRYASTPAPIHNG